MPEKKPKTQGQKIRAVLYLLWEAEGQKGECDNYYIEKTDKYIDFLKRKLERLQYGY